MSLFVVLVDGLDVTYLQGSRAYRGSKLAATADLKRLLLPNYCHGESGWASVLSGTLPHENRVLTDPPWLPPGWGEQPPGLLHQSLLTAADLDGKSTTAVNLPSGWIGASDAVCEIGSEFFRSGDAKALRGVPETPLRASCLAAEQITPGHFKQLHPELASYPDTDRRKQICRALLAQAITQHNAATAVVSAETDLTVVRYDWLEQFFAAFIDYDAPAPYLPTEDAPVFRGVLESAIDLLVLFVERLRELSGAETFLVVSDHGWKKRPGGGRRKETPENYDLSDERVDVELAMQTPAQREDYINHGAFVLRSTAETRSAAMPEPLSVKSSADWIAERLGIEHWVDRSEQVEQLTRAIIDQERRNETTHTLLDDSVELGLLTFTDEEDAKREHGLFCRDRLLASSYSLAEEWSEGVAAWQRVSARRYSLASELGVLACRYEMDDLSGAYEMSARLARLAPRNFTVLTTWFHTAHALGHRRAAHKALIMLCESEGREETGAAELAQKLSVEYGYRLDGFEKYKTALDWTNQLSVSCEESRWRELNDSLAKKSSSFIQAMHELKQLDLRPVEAYLQAHFEAPECETADFHSRLRSRGIASARRHADPSQAHGLNEARRLKAEHEKPQTLLAESRSLHTLLFADHPKIAGRLRRDEDGMRVFSRWLDGSSSGIDQLIVNGSVEEMISEIEAGIARLRDKVAPPLLAAMLCYDIWVVHPFIDGNGRVARLLANRLLERQGVVGVDLLNIERRLDRCRALFDSTVGLSRTTNHPEWFFTFWVSFLARSAEDTLRRSRRLLLMLQTDSKT